jgi:glyoxylase-like metal-dependent hydrolase (beta-lactamase superfamily II)
VTQAGRRRELGRGERVLPGVWRLRLPLPWPGVPHCNAWALAAGDGIVLVDTGMHEPGSLAHLERALDQVRLSLDHVRLLVCTHAHSDHYGQAGPIVARTGAQLWMHPDHEHMTRAASDPEAAWERRVEVARQSGVPEAPLRRWAEQRRAVGSGLSGELVSDRDLLPGVTVASDLGDWQVVETPGHAPSHVVLHQPDRKLLLSGDHVLGRASLYFDYGYTPDPVGEYMESLARVRELDVDLILAGHGRPVRDLPRLVDAHEDLVIQALERVREALAEEPRTPYDIVSFVLGVQDLPPAAVSWGLSLTLCYLQHLERHGAVARVEGSDPEVWQLV